jgi:ATP-binding cassette, subfamily C, bacterial LapB
LVQTTVDPLIEALSIVLALHQHKISATALAESISLPVQLNEDEFVRLAEANRCAVTLRERKLEKISDLVLPVILILKEKQVAVASRRISPTHYGVYLPDTGMQEHEIFAIITIRMPHEEVAMVIGFGKLFGTIAGTISRLRSPQY